jgi:hypothetical protein
MKARKSSIAFVAISVVFFFILLNVGGIYFNSSTFAEGNKKIDSKVKFMPDLKNWPAASQAAIKEMIKKYGLPDEVTEHSLVWYNNGPWKYTKVFDSENKHLFPIDHTDVIEQAIDYKVPLNKFNDLALYDGSITIKRTDGELSVRCDREAVNFLTINLVNNVAIGKMTVGEAKTFHANVVKDFILNGRESPYMQSFQFSISKGKTADADRHGVAEDEHAMIVKKIKEINREAKEKEKLGSDRTIQ